MRALVVVLSLMWALPKGDASQAAGVETLIGIVGNDFVLLGADSSVSQSLALTASNLDKIAVISEPFLVSDDTPRNPNQQQTIVAAAAGDAANADRLVGMLQRHATVREYEAGIGCDVEIILGSEGNVKGQHFSEPGLSVEAVAQLARGQLSASFRDPRAPGNVCLLVAGMMHLGRKSNVSATPTFISRQVQTQVSEAHARSVNSNGQGPEHHSASAETTRQLEPRLYWIDELGSVQKIQYGVHGYGSSFVLSILDQGFREGMSREEAAKLMKECFQQLRTRYVINSPQPPCIKCVDAMGCHLVR